MSHKFSQFCFKVKALHYLLNYCISFMVRTYLHKTCICFYENKVVFFLNIKNVVLGVFSEERKKSLSSLTTRYNVGKLKHSDVMSAIYVVSYDVTFDFLFLWLWQHHIKNLIVQWQYRLWIIQLMNAVLQEDCFVFLVISEKLTFKKRKGKRLLIIN